MEATKYGAVLFSVLLFLGVPVFADSSTRTVTYPVTNGTETIGAMMTTSHLINLNISHAQAVKSHIVFLQFDGVTNTITVRLNNSICGSPTTVITGATVAVDCTHRSNVSLVSGVVNISFTNNNILTDKTISAWQTITYEDSGIYDKINELSIDIDADTIAEKIVNRLCIVARPICQDRFRKHYEPSILEMVGDFR